jgi:hypothetical protein
VLSVVARRWVLTDNTFWHARWDHLLDFIIIITIIFIDFVISVNFVNRG